MSSTKRGRDREREDNYPTESWCVRRLLEAVPLPGGRWLEPAAGDGAIIKAVNAVRTDILWTAAEIRPEMREKLDEVDHIENVLIGDYIAISANLSPWQYGVIVTNPPFKLAEEFVRSSNGKGYHIIMLLRLNFLGSVSRMEWLRETKPNVYILPNRPSFLKVPSVDKRGVVKRDASGKVKMKKVTDSIEYAWFHWHPSASGLWRILNETSKEERRLG